ncbi:hypothetical protein ASG14_14075 [Pedobacter sp. Leaf194]|nr:hypothetical protein ASG14_14075 [Pedobacter sp. Leaf194]
MKLAGFLILPQIYTELGLVFCVFCVSVADIETDAGFLILPRKHRFTQNWVSCLVCFYKANNNL